MQAEGQRFRIAIVSDFFLPGFGGVEIHIYNLAQCLMKRGHKIIILTRAYGDRRGVRWITNGVKVYYLPYRGVNLPPGTVTLPTVIGAFPLMRNIFIRERIDIVHGHQTTSNLAHEAMMHARTMGIRVCFTDHSLFGFGDAASIHINKVLEWTLRDVDHVICVSYTSRENTVLRARIHPLRVSVIPNATDTTHFLPPSSLKYRSWASETVQEVTFVIMTRLVYRKGVDLLCAVVPELCHRYPHVRFVIGGDGPRRLQVDEMVEKNSLYDKVELVGEVAHANVPAFLRRGQIFLNFSLTEAFCIAILEAASCGLLVVSTRVGGVPEVLPEDMLLLAEPDVDSLVHASSEAMKRIASVEPWDFHRRVTMMYSWSNVAERTEKVYNKVVAQPPRSMLHRVEDHFKIGLVWGKVTAAALVLDYIVLWVLERLWPVSSIDVAVDFPSDKYQSVKDQLTREDASGVW